MVRRGWDPRFRRLGQSGWGAERGARGARGVRARGGLAAQGPPPGASRGQITGSLRTLTKITEEAAGLVSIGQLARDAGVSSRTIRYYEELGIIPEPRRSAGGTRKYPREYGSYIETALALKDLGFRLSEIKPLARRAVGRPLSCGQRDTPGRVPCRRTTPLVHP